MQLTLKNIIFYLTYLGVFTAAFFLPLKTSISNIGLLLFFSSTIFSFIFYGFDQGLKKPKIVYILMPWALAVPLMVPGLIISVEFSEAFHEIVKYLFLLIVPLALFRKDLIKDELIKISSFGLILGSLVSATVLLYNNIATFLIANLPFVKLFSSHYTNFNFTSYFVEMHPLYLGTYYLLALILLIKKSPWKNKFVKISAYLLLFATIIFLNSRIIYGLTGFILLFILVKSLPWKISLGISICLILIFFIFYPFVSKTYIYNKVIYATVWDLSKNIGTHNTDSKTTSDSRLSRWVVGWEAFKEKPFLGYGTGLEKDVLSEKYRMYSMEVSLNNNYDSHNQYLSYLIRFGIIGGLFIFGYIILNCFLALQERNIVYFGYILIVGTVFLVENYIDRNMGINFVALFGTLLCIENNNISKNAV